MAVQKDRYSIRNNGTTATTSRTMAQRPQTRYKDNKPHNTYKRQNNPTSHHLTI